MQAFLFPENFALGVASAATQIDGHCKTNNWYDWYLKGHIVDNSNPDVTTLHRDYWREDTELMAGMGIGHYRFGIEWGRIEAEEGVFSAEEFAAIRQEILYLKENNIQVLMTLHHFSNPLWFEKKGGFLAPDALGIFLRFVSKVVEELGDLIEEYITINEPNVYATGGYFGMGFPPGQNNAFKTLKVMNVLGECHRQAYLLIHRKRREMGYENTKVSFAHHMRAFAPMNPKNLWHKLSCIISEYLFQGKITKEYLLGKKKDDQIYADFLALNYYSRTASKGLEDGTFPGSNVNDLNWEIYPEGIRLCAQDLHNTCPNLPIYITENGTADKKDQFRRRYLYEHLKSLVDSSLPVTRYYHWCFVDNWEWLEGFTTRFGLVYLDLNTQKRSIKKSGEFYSQMIVEHGITKEMAEEALKESYYDYKGGRISF